MTLYVSVHKVFRSAAENGNQYDLGYASVFFVGMHSLGRDHVDALLGAVNVLYLGLWVSYFVAMILSYWLRLLAAAEVVRWFR